MFNPKTFLKEVTSAPGVYEMLDTEGVRLYVGKAKNLKKRLSSYFSSKPLPPKTRAMVRQIADVRVTVTHSESEALILENNLIKTFHPKYNILMRDDKSYPYIVLTKHKRYPRLDVYRGKRTQSAEFFGPYPSVGAVRETMRILQKLFKLRQCSDTFFKNRVRPCLQYQINRCSAPCVKHISPDNYARDVAYTRLFLQGKNQEIINVLAAKMDEAAKTKHYEEAAYFRDQIASLRSVQEKQYVSSQQGEADVFAIVIEKNIICVGHLVIREGQLLANQCFFPSMPLEKSEADILSAFLSQYYLSHVSAFGFPKEVIANVPLEDKDILSESLSSLAGHKVLVKDHVREDRAKWVSLAVTNATTYLAQQIQMHMHTEARWLALQHAFGLSTPMARVECFDISHTMGEATVASCVVFDKEGAVKHDYRRFNIRDITPGDDYAAMRQALLRRYERVKKEEGKLPDVILIDGGKGQLSQAIEVLEELQISDVLLVGVAKGPSRKAGLEQLFIHGKTHAVTLSSDDPALHLIQCIRDEAHRFAITGHRQRRQQARTVSSLEHIPGVGPKRRRELLRQFGGLQGLKKASVDEVAKVPGISVALAKKIVEGLR